MLDYSIFMSMSLYYNQVNHELLYNEMREKGEAGQSDTHFEKSLNGQEVWI